MELKTETPFPKYVIINIGSLCKYACIFCLNSKIKEHIYLSFFQIKDIILTFPEGTTVDLSGYGEAMLRPDFEDIIHWVTNKKIPFDLSTSGEPLTENLQDLLRKSSLRNINFSLNSVNPETKKILSGGRGDFNLVMKHFKSFVAKPRNYEVSITMVVNRHNFREMPDFVRFAIEHEVNWMGLHQLVNGIDYPKDLLLLDDEEELKFIKEANEIARDNNMPISGLCITPREGIDYQIGKNPIKSCTFPWTQTVIGPTGNIVACCLSSRVVGNIFTSSFYETWNGEKMNELRDAILDGDDKFCKGCVLYEK